MELNFNEIQVKGRCYHVVMIFLFLIVYAMKNYLLEAIRDFLPKKAHKTFEGIMASINGAARSFISGAAIDCTLVFIVSL